MERLSTVNFTRSTGEQKGYLENARAWTETPVLVSFCSISRPLMKRDMSSHGEAKSLSSVSKLQYLIINIVIYIYIHTHTHTYILMYL